MVEITVKKSLRWNDGARHLTYWHLSYLTLEQSRVFI